MVEARGFVDIAVLLCRMCMYDSSRSYGREWMIGLRVLRYAV